MYHRLATLIGLVPCLSVTSAFPTALGKRSLTPFDAASQAVSTTGEHAFIAPTAGDSRGPCPALNALANHGYINRSGENITLVQIEEALPGAIGIAPDLTAALAAIGLIFNGDLASFSVGGWPSMFAGVDALVVRDLYNMGELNAPDAMVKMTKAFAANNDGGDGDPGDPIASGTLGPFDDVIVIGMMSNHSAEHPDGTLGPSSFLPFLTTTMSSTGTFTKNYFQERIPDNWYKRNDLDQYTAAGFALDVATMAAAGGLFNRGGNESWFTLIDIPSLTNGAYSQADMQDPALEMCFFTQAASVGLPAIVGQSALSSSLKQSVSSAMASFQQGTSTMSCQGRQLKALNLNLLSSLLGINLLGL